MNESPHPSHHSLGGDRNRLCLHLWFGERLWPPIIAPDPIRTHVKSRRVRPDRQPGRQPDRRLRPRSKRQRSPRPAPITPAGSEAPWKDPSSTISPRRARWPTIATNGLLYAVNAGSNTISVFAVYGDQLALRQVIGSGGAFPVSIAVDHGLVYVLNAEEGGSLQGYVVDGGHLLPIPGSSRPLGLNPTETPQFTHTPGQVSVLAGRLTADRHDEGQRQRYRRLPGRALRTPVRRRRSSTPSPARCRSRRASIRRRPARLEAGTNALASFALNPTAASRSSTPSPRARRRPAGSSRRGGISMPQTPAVPRSVLPVERRRTALTLLGQTATDGGTVDAAARATVASSMSRPAPADRRRVRDRAAGRAEQSRLGHRSRRCRRRGNRCPSSASERGYGAFREAP